MRYLLTLIFTASALAAALPSEHLPRVVDLGDGTAARINRIDATDIGYDLGAGADLATFAATDTGRAVPPLAGFDPATAEAWPTDTVLIAQINNPPTPAAVIAPVTRRQLFLWLNAQGHTRAALRALLAAIPDEQAREAALIEFDEAQEFRRNHPLINQLAAALGYTSAQIDAGFTAAAQL